MQTLAILAFGSKVQIGGDITGVIAATSIRPAREDYYVCYEVEYWDG